MRSGSKIPFPPFSFTLIEVVVVVAVLSLTAALAVSRFQGESPARLLENTLTDFEGFCGRVRYRAVEDGLDWVVRFHPETRRFTALRQARRETRVFRNSEDAGALSLEEDVEDEEASQAPEAEGEDVERSVSSSASEAAARLVWNLPEKISFSVPDETDQDFDEAQEGGFDLFRFFPDGACGGDTLLIFHCGEFLARTVSISKLTGRMIVTEGDSTLQAEGEESGSGTVTVTRQKAVYGENI